MARDDVTGLAAKAIIMAHHLWLFVMVCNNEVDGVASRGALSCCLILF